MKYGPIDDATIYLKGLRVLHIERLSADPSPPGMLVSLA